MKILVTGGGGFIGSYVVKKLLGEGCDAAIFDSFVSYLSPLDSFYQIYIKERLKDIKDKVEIIRGDTRNKSEVYRAVHYYRPNRILHLAALPIADLCDKYPEEALSSIINGTANLIEVIRDVGGVDRFVYISSSMIYGDFQYKPADEEHPKNPQSIYGGTKLAGEIISKSLCNRFGVDYTIIRPSAVYGPTDANRRVTQIFVENALKKNPLILYGEGEEELDFTYVKDTAQGIVLAALKPEGRNQVFNITQGEGRSLQTLANIITTISPGSEIIKKEKKMHCYSRPKRGALNITKAKNLLGYKPEYSLEKGMEEYIKFVKDLNIIK